MAETGPVFFCIGGKMPQPPTLAEHVWQFSNSRGYDGQWYHLMVHDPSQTRGIDRFIDNPRVRYRRILLPILVYGLAAGQDGWEHGAYVAVVLLCIFLGAYWLSRYGVLHGFRARLGVGFLFVPAVLV